MKKCEHLEQAHDQALPTRRVCEDCIKTGDSWVHLRQCLTCGHVGCCDSSKNKHATAHYHAAKHPMVKSLEPGETWGWCYIHEIAYELSGGVAHARILQ